MGHVRRRVSRGVGLFPVLVPLPERSLTMRFGPTRDVVFVEGLRRAFGVAGKGGYSLITTLSLSVLYKKWLFGTNSRVSGKRSYILDGLRGAYSGLPEVCDRKGMVLLLSVDLGRRVRGRVCRLALVMPSPKDGASERFGPYFVRVARFIVLVLGVSWTRVAIRKFWSFEAA